MANTPAWFDEAYYLSSKLAQLRSKGLTQYQNIVDVKVALEAAGYTPFSHFQAMGLIERTSPNQYFNATEYLNAKAQQVNAKQGVTTWNADNIALAIYDAGMTIWEHFQKFGWKEGVNPSNAFDVNAYFESKLAAVQAKDPDGGWTLEKVKDAFEAAGLDPITHYVEYGKNEEGVTVSPAKDPVPSDDRTGGEVFTLTINQDNLTGTAGNDVFSAPAAQNGVGALINTLQNVDTLDGGAGTDTLRATLTEGAPAVAPTLKNIENVEVRFANAAADLSLANATGVESVVVADSTTAGTISNLGTIANLAVNNQNSAVTFAGNTAATLNFGFNNVGKDVTAANEVVVTAATGATTGVFALKNANVDLTAVATLKNVTVNASGNNRLDLTAAAAAVETIVVNGDGKVNLDTDFTAVKSINAAENTGGFTVKSVDADAIKITGGAGADSVTYSAAVAANANVDLGAGNDTLTLTAGVTAGATLNGGEGTDTLAMTTAAYEAVAAFTAPNLAKITGFEVLSITDVLADTKNIDVSKIAGINSFETVGVTTGKSATVSNLGADTAVVMKGDLATNGGTLVVALKDATGASDAVNLTLNHSADLVGAVAVTSLIGGLAGVETLNVNAIATDTAPATAGSVTYTLTVANTATALQTVNVSGDQTVSLTTDAAWTKLSTIDASANTAGVTINAAAAVVTAPALTITGTSKADVITGTTLGDTITLGGGNDILAYDVGGASTIGTGKFDTITDFQANTFGNGTDGAAGTGAGAQANWTGDVLRFDRGDGSDGALVDVFSNAADALTFLNNNHAATNGITAALDSSTGNLYVDNTGDGIADYFIQLTGVTTIDAAAFVVV